MIRFASAQGGVAPPMHTASGKALRHSSASPRHRSGFNTTNVGERACRFLRRLYPTRTAENIAADLAAWGVRTSTIAKMLERMTAPSAVMSAALICTYGPDYLAAILPACPDWLDKAKRDARTAQLETEIAEKRRELEALSR